jgi:hypothetical protein
MKVRSNKNSSNLEHLLIQNNEKSTWASVCFILVQILYKIQLIIKVSSIRELLSWPGYRRIKKKTHWDECLFLYVISFTFFNQILSLRCAFSLGRQPSPQPQNVLIIYCVFNKKLSEILRNEVKNKTIENWNRYTDDPAIRVIRQENWNNCDLYN